MEPGKKEIKTISSSIAQKYLVEPLSVACNNVSVVVENIENTFDYVVNRNPSSKSIIKVIDQVTFDAAPGQIIAIMGASGSGKTTLLNALAGRIQPSSGQVLFGNQNPQIFYSNGSTGYVRQHDYLMPYLTVRETLRYTAELRLPQSLKTKQKHDAVERVITDLGLKECANTIIGDDWRKGISGGEKRRVSVACQLLLNPSLLFIDEATTGLDAYTSRNLVETLKSLSKEGRTIFLTIHQPRSDITELFDSVILLSKGKMVYAGAAGTKMISYFQTLNHTCLDSMNPADFIIDITSLDDSTAEKERESIERVDLLTSAWAKKVQDKSIKDLEYPLQPEIKQLQQEYDSQGLATSKKRNGANLLNQIGILTARGWKNQLRDNLMLWGNLVEVVFVGVVFGWIFFQLPQTLSGVLTRRASLYITASVQTYLQLIFVVYKTTGDLKVFDRERADRIYDVLPYVSAQFISQLPFNILFPTVFSVIMYFMIGLRTDDLAINLFRFVLANVLAHFVVVAYSLFCCAFARDFATASLIANSLFTFFSFSAGYFIQLDSIPPGLKWTSYWSFLTWEFRLMASNEFSNNVYTCSDIGQPCLGNDVLYSLGIPVDYYIWPIIGLVLNYVGFTLVAIITLQFYLPAETRHAKPISSNKSQIHPNIHKDEDIVNYSNHVQRIRVDLKAVDLKIESTDMLKRNVKQKTLLDGISSSFPPGQLSIIMGGSGTGKSTLLSILCGRNLSIGVNSKLIEGGDILFNGVPQTHKTIASVCSFVRQSDEHLLPALTCRETLEFAAALRLPVEMPREKKMERARQVLAVLGLKHCADTVVGSELLKGLSGGEKRRLSIGIQMITDPSILVIDEPTSGLDAFTARYVMQTLKEIASSGRTVICSIHQPRSDIFEMFDSILLLARGGKVAYSGPRSQIISYFGQLDYKLPRYTNPADFILDVTSIDFRTLQAEIESVARVEKIIESFKSKKDSLLKEVEDPVEALGKLKPRKMIPFRYALPVLTYRSFLNSKRQPHIIIARIMQVVFLGVIICLYYARQGYTQISVQNRLGILQQSLSVLFIGLLNCVAVFPAERNLLFFEYADGTYSVEPFMVAYNFIEIPIEFISACLFTIFAMVIVGLNLSVTNYFCYVLTVFALVNLGESIGIIFCSIVDHVGFSVSLTNSLLGVFTVMSGLMSADMPLVLDRFNMISPVPYFTRLITINEFPSSVTFSCTPQDIAANICIYQNGTDVLNLLAQPGRFSFDPSKFVFYILTGSLLTIAYRILAYLVLKARCYLN